MKKRIPYLKANLIQVLSFLIFLLMTSHTVSAQYPAGSPVAMNGKLKVVGTKLTSECGNAVQLRGMSSHGLQWFGNCNTGGALDALTNTWKVDIFRLAMYVQEGGYVNNPSSWKTTIDNYVDACATRGIYCLIDWHVLTPGDPNANIAESRDFWTYMATKHGSKKHVLYEICNEPNGVSWSTVKMYANDIIPRIRAIDPNTVIIVGTPNWSQDVDVASRDKLNYTNIMYTLHFYSGTHTQSFRDKGNTAMSNGAAIFCTEWGTSQASGNGGVYTAEADNWINWMATNQISWCNWSFSDNTESSAALNSGSCAGGNWNNTSTSGTYVKGKLTGTADNFTNCGGATNQLPSVSITSPANNSTFTAPANITINATASDPDGTISKVDFYNGSTLLISDGSSPYSYSWTNVAAGTYTITAKATDNAGGVTTSAAITVVVSLPSNQLPVVTITSPANNATYTAPASITINATASDPDGTISKVDFYNGTTLLGSDASSPYSYNWTNVPLGTYTITAKATDNAGGATTSTAVTVIVSVPQGPYAAGTPIPIPGTVESEKYDVGGQGIAYNDADAVNSGGQFRTDGVDIETCTDAGAGYSIGYAAAGEWLEYTVNVTATGTYNFNARVASTVAGKTLHIEMNGVNVTGTMAVPNTGGYQTWQTITVSNVNLTIGNNQIMRVYFDTDAINLNYVSVTSANQAPTVSISSPANNASFCAGATITLTATAADVDGTVSKVDFYDGTTLLGTITTSPYIYNWTSAGTGTHSITAKATDNGTAATTSTAISITINANPSAPTVNAAITYCQNATASAMTATGTALKWYTASTGGTGSTTAPTPVTTTAGTTNYYVSQTVNGCESPRALITVTVNATPSAPSVTALVTYCQNATASTLTATGTALKWYTVSTGGTGSTTTPTPITTAAGTTNYYVSQATNGCEGPRAMIAVAVNALPSSPGVISPLTYCQNAPATQLTANGTSLRWYTASSGGTGSTTAPIPSTAAVGTINYFVSQTTNNCESARATIAVTTNIAATATITAGGAINFCQGGSVTLTANAGSSYIWMNGATQVGTGSSYTATTSGSYTVQVSNPSGCQGQVTSSATTVTVNALPISTITAGGSTTFCQGGSVNLTASSGSSYVWFNSTSQVGTSASLTVTTSGNYTVQITNSFNCKATSAATTVAVNVLPTATITAGGPTTFTQGGSVLLSANTGTGLTYKWFNGSVQLGTNSTYTATAGGTYTLEVTNTLGCKATSTPVVVTVNGNLLPSVNITSPGNNTALTAPANVSITVTATDTDGSITKVDFYNGTVLLGTSATLPYNLALNNLNTGTYIIKAVATDNLGGTASSSPITITVINPLPTINITAPQDGKIYVAAATVTIDADATDANGTVTKVDFYAGTTLLGTDASSPYTFTWTNVVAGTYVITVKATDNEGGVSTSSAITITVNANQSSNINITSPTNNSTVTGTSVTINVSATDPDGSIALVEYYDGTTIIGSSTTQPYSFTWNNPTAGTHNITVKVTDSNGGVTTSSPTTVQISSQTSVFSPLGYGAFTNVYPNPSHETFTLKSSEEIKALWIVNMLGEQLSSLQNIQAGQQIEIGKELPDGTFVLLIKYASDKMEVAKIVKIK